MSNLSLQSWFEALPHFILFSADIAVLQRARGFVQAFREDRTLIAASDYIADALGQRFVESVPLNMERAWSESHPKCPLICLLSPGADPTKLIEVCLSFTKLLLLCTVGNYCSVVSGT